MMANKDQTRRMIKQTGRNNPRKLKSMSETETNTVRDTKITSVSKAANAMLYPIPLTV